MISAWTACTVPPTVQAVKPVDHRRRAVHRLALLGDGDTRARIQPARTPSTRTGAACPDGRCTTIAAGLVEPAGLVGAYQFALGPAVAVHASQTSGGQSGSTPTPSMRPRNSSRTAQSGAGSDRPTVERRPRVPAGPGTRRPRCPGAAVRCGRDRRFDVTGGVAAHVLPATPERSARSRVVAKTTDSVGLGTRGRRRGTRRHATRCARRRGQPERHRYRRRRRRQQPQPDQVQELQVHPVGYPVEPEQQLVGHVREGLDERHARVGHVVVGPLRAAAHHHPLGVVDEILESPVVEVGCGQGHQ